MLITRDLAEKLFTTINVINIAAIEPSLPFFVPNKSWYRNWRYPHITSLVVYFPRFPLREFISNKEQKLLPLFLTEFHLYLSVSLSDSVLSIFLSHSKRCASAVICGRRAFIVVVVVFVVVVVVVVVVRPKKKIGRTNTIILRKKLDEGQFF
jgi:hypothetical protein